jgi:putative cell wall-binding protein
MWIVLAIASVLPLAAAPAHAITSGAHLRALTSPPAGIGKTQQAAGTWTLTPDTPSETWAQGEQVTLKLDDSDPAGSTCVSGDTLAYSALPSVDSDGSAVVQRSPEGSGLGCGQNVLRLNFTGSGTGTITITNLKYDVGPAASAGAVKITATDSVGTVDTASGSNAFLTTTAFRANSPPKGSEKDSGIQIVSPLVVAEQTATGADGDLCFVLGGAGNTFDTTGPVPTVSVTGGNDLATVENRQPTSFRLAVAPPGPTSASTFTINGVRRTTINVGHDLVTVYADDDGTCATPDSGTQLSIPTTIGFVGFFQRLGGSDRIVTAQKIFDDGWGCVAPNNNNIDDVAILARADLFPDALAASYLAGQRGTGILLTNPASIPAATLNALRVNGINRVFIIGGTGAVSAGVETQLKGTLAYQCGGTAQVTPATNLSVTRIGGVSREDTARAVAEFPGLDAAGVADYDGTPLASGSGDPNGATCDARKTAIVATSEDFPDALAAGSVAYQGISFFDAACLEAGTYGKPIPLLLTRGSGLSGAASAGLQNLGIKQVLLMGGTGAISPAVESQIQNLGIVTRRFGGANRQATAALFATFSIDFLGYDDGEVSIARGDLFPDALAGGPHSGDSPEPNAIVLASSPSTLGADTTSWFVRSGVDTFGAVIDRAVIYGGLGAVQAQVVDAILAALSQSDAS